MPHPESEHGLRVQLATALREAERLEGTLASAFGDLRESEKRAEAADSALAAANARADAAEAELAEYRSWSPSRADAMEALAAARRECDLLRDALRDIAAECYAQDDNFARCDQTTHQIARAALAAPAAASDTSPATLEAWEKRLQREAEVNDPNESDP